MQFKALTFIALLAPLPAAAFGDMDCISIEQCDASGCGPMAPSPFAVTFDWSASKATITFDGVERTLAISAPAMTPDTDTVVLQSVIKFGDQRTTRGDALLRIEADSDAINAMFIFKDTMENVVVGTCDVRTAA